ncbi:hypothetical protein CAOG_02814 [Capsaspora owczarzaki ATCC 30864]|uniref:AAA+ ATPase domain-containing protein n=1 Tax=Capsaspora owczarzaki (strain ATCC 30864) TaxID=595528 RepID=A0A0D2X205_CAPO3|nr:hypothetical protein CAOG_02814 [Capsaspora owczarzaki ATCC 30864]KJE91719.1 hypothetical protein CAOG_002814 [Capsaspora owczarzaki ATCC 30864]|eukprot:XP_004348627.1 hypothetical protein CAOG_02814 [Capsaspora owczarzaki ATCC 30864]
MYRLLAEVDRSPLSELLPFEVAGALLAALAQQQPTFRRVFGLIGGAVAKAVSTTFIILVVAAFFARHVLDNKNTIAKTHSPEIVQARMLARFEAGSVIPRFEKYHVSRPDAVAMLQKVLRPAPLETYTVVVGEVGCGKTSAVHDAIRANSTGIVYHIVKSEVLVSMPGLLAGSLAFEFNQFTFTAGYFKDRGIEMHQIASAEEPFKSWAILELGLRDVAAQFKAKHGHVATLVIDAVDQIAQQGPALLHVIQNFAKAAADEQLLNVVLVTCDGSNLPELKASSAMTRARIVEVSDITDEQAVDFLLHRGVNEDSAKRAVAEIAGGRFVLLNRVTKQLGRGQQVNQIFEEFRVDTADSLQRLIDDLALYNATSDVHKTLCDLTHGALHIDIVHCALGKDLTKKLLATNINILAYHPNDTYTLHSRHVQRSVSTLLNCTRPLGRPLFLAS